MRLAIVNYGLGNLHSLANAFEYCGQRPDVSGDAAGLIRYDALVLPGVGAFGDGMDRLRADGLDAAVRQFAERDRPLLGICLGMHLLMEDSEEFGHHAGLGLIEGHVRSFYNLEGFDKKAKVPHTGWNNIAIKTETPLLGGMDDQDMYFVHSFCAVTEDPCQTLASASYGGVDFSAVIGRGRLYGCQFHPEKSSEGGLQIIRNFIQIAEDSV